MNILLWHVHGAWTTAFVHGRHNYLIPVDELRGPNGRGRARTYTWPESAREVTIEQARDEPIDAVILQRPEELSHLVEAWTGRRPGRDIPAIYVEHNTPQGEVNAMRHVAADRPDLRLVHVTHFNRLFWDGGSTPSQVIEHGIVDPGYRYTGNLPHAAVVVNEPRRRGRVTGTDLLGCARDEGLPVDLFGMQSEGAGGLGDLPQADLHAALADRRVYLHTARWTSLGLSLIEAMQLGLPVVALATTELAAVVPGEAGVVATNTDELMQGVRRLLSDPLEARMRGCVARSVAAERFALERFLDDWDAELMEAVA